MAVYTRLEVGEIKKLVDEYDLGELVAYSEIEGGIENTNYFLDLSSNDAASSRFVLTLFENVARDELPFFTKLTSFLESEGFPVPAPRKMSNGGRVFALKGKDGVIVPCLPGVAKVSPTLADCEELGALMARMHQALRSFKAYRQQGRSRDWMISMQAQMADNLPSALKDELDFYLGRFDTYSSNIQSCEQGLIHGDLFVDNVLFTDQRISGVIDFYHACSDAFIFDIAVAANDWCWSEDRYDEAKLSQMLHSYQAVSPWSEEERSAWPAALELAALRFWISRLHSRYVEGYQKQSLSGDKTKDPEGMATILRFLLNQKW